MFRPIRRKKNELSAEAAERLLETERRGVLAVLGDEGYPYAVPINFYFDREKNRIVFHGAAQGHKTDAIENCDKVCFTVTGPEKIKDSAWAPYVQSAVVFGRCRVLTDPGEASVMLKKFAMKYYPDEKTCDEEIARSGKAARMYEIKIEHVSGKEVQER